MPQSLACLDVHLVFSTKHREPLLVSDLAPRLYGYIGGILRADGSCLIEAGGMPDLVHLLVSLGRQMSVADTVRQVKSNSSRWVHETFRERWYVEWQKGYGAFAVSHSTVKAVRKYIQNQAEHHRVRTFQEEFRELLRKHEIGGASVTCGTDLPKTLQSVAPLGLGEG
jgi:REP element-mobilizing transposase RayT